MYDGKNRMFAMLRGKMDDARGRTAGARVGPSEYVEQLASHKRSYQDRT